MGSIIPPKAPPGAKAHCPPSTQRCGGDAVPAPAGQRQPGAAPTRGAPEQHGWAGTRRGTGAFGEAVQVSQEQEGSTGAGQSLTCLLTPPFPSQHCLHRISPGTQLRSPPCGSPQAFPALDAPAHDEAVLCSELRTAASMALLPLALLGRGPGAISGAIHYWKGAAR